VQILGAILASIVQNKYIADDDICTFSFPMGLLNPLFYTVLTDETGLPPDYTP